MMEEINERVSGSLSNSEPVFDVFADAALLPAVFPEGLPVAVAADIGAEAFVSRECEPPDEATAAAAAAYGGPLWNIARTPFAR